MFSASIPGEFYLQGCVVYLPLKRQTCELTAVSLNIKQNEYSFCLVPTEDHGN